jgi:hypothetical protein
MVLGALTVLLGAWLLTRVGDWSPPQPHYDFAGPTDFSSLSARDLALIVIGVIALGCGFLGLGWWLRPKKAAHPPGLPDARVVRDD